MTRYEYAKDMYAKIGIDTEAAIEKLSALPISMHCWQGDDVVGFDSKEALSGGIQTTGNYPGKATTPEELMADLDKASVRTAVVIAFRKPADSTCTVARHNYSFFVSLAKDVRSTRFVPGVHHKLNISATDVYNV